jgi:hypothetical protein
MIEMNTAVVVPLTILMCATAALLSYTSTATVLGLIVMFMMMEQVLSLVKTQITV